MSRRAAFGARLTGDSPSCDSTSTRGAPAPPAAAAAAAAPTPEARQHQSQSSRGGGNSGRGKNSGRGGRNHQSGGGGGHHHQHAARSPPKAGPAAAATISQDRLAQIAAVNARAAAMAKAAADQAALDGTDGQEGEICFICAEGPVEYWSVGECNHRTCHTCSIRLRALYKKNECTFCKTECPTVVFTASDEKPFEEFKPDDTPFSDTKLGVLFETRAQLDDTLSLLRFNCPFKPGLSDPSSAAPDDPAEACQHILAGWSDLKRHVRSSHHCTLCDLCCSNKKIFTHEHELFAMGGQNQNGGASGSSSAASMSGGGRRKGTELDHHLEKEHSMCGFCKRWFFDSDGLYKHCRDHHEECFICMKLGIRHQYHLNYDRLEQHFKTDHFLCPHPDCLAQKFVVFESELDLQAHALEVHGVGSVDQKARKEARRIETSFTYSTGETSRGTDAGAANRRRAAASSAANGRPPAASFVEPAREDPVPTPRGERRIPGLGAMQALGQLSGSASGGASSRAARFGGHLTPDPASTPSGSGRNTPTQQDGTADSVTLERHAALMRRVRDATHGNEGKVAGFKIAVRSYRAGELSARDLCDQLYNIFDQRTDEAGAIVLNFAELLDDDEKRRALQSSWREMSSENQFPSLIALAPTLNGIPTQVNNTSQRALSTQHRNTHNPSSTWARVEQAARSSGPAPVAPRSNPFPALINASNAKQIPGLSKAGTQKKRTGASSTAWSSAAGGGPTASTSSAAGAGPMRAGPAFPSLGAASSSSATAPATRSGSGTPVSISRPGSASAFGGSSRAAAAPRGANGLDFPSLQLSTTEADRRARMRAALAKPAARTVMDDSEADGGIWNGSGGVGGENGFASGSSAAAAAAAKKKGKGRQKTVLMSGGLASQPK
ncbi:hypothetical protein BMF94_3973 [Rhodotorula taiwanensis]|uniref:RING-type E3 ubiquitin transferase n=1 Tax=Rhodotorula taiwanensis TaxID=741276 RepID=A0A2S5B8A1_9BASI|nr:hypothetical protein BMF94_3973 [Rhodotorula taiwanensis]